MFRAIRFDVVEAAEFDPYQPGRFSRDMPERTRSSVHCSM